MAGASTHPRLGLVVNPIAGMGGRVALKGTDGAEALREARARGAVPVAADRARQTLALLAEQASPVSVLAAPGEMGADLAREAGLEFEPTDSAPRRETCAADTRAAVVAMRHRGVDLLLFAGGDGTARDILAAGGAELPLVGVPSGVKMHSGVFAATPRAAGTAAAAYLRDPRPSALREAEIADVDEGEARDGRLTTRLHGVARVPRQPLLMLGRKAPSGPLSADGVHALAEAIAPALRCQRLTLLGPGGSTAAILQHLGVRGTLLGVDAVRGGEVVGRDLDEAGLLRLLDGDGGGDAQLVVGVVGGQGALFGRGNQQLSPAVLRRIGRARVRIVAAADKLLVLDPPCLRVDTGDPELDAELCGYVQVEVAPKRSIVMKVST